MAHRVKKFPKNTGRASNGSKYPWHQYMDGSIWSLQEGKDFKTKMASFRSLAIMTANRMGKKLQSVVDGKQLYIQATKTKAKSNGKPKGKIFSSQSSTAAKTGLVSK